MAQCCGTTTYNFFWDEQLRVAIVNLTLVADCCAGNRGECLDHSCVLALILAILSARRMPILHERRSLEQWLALIESPELECRSLLPKADDETIAVVVSSLRSVLSRAMSLWSEGDPQEPLPEHVLNCLVAELHDCHADVRPPNPGLPRHKTELGSI